MSASAGQLIVAVHEAGGLIQASGNKLRLKAPAPLPDPLIEALRVAERDIIRTLAEDEQNAFEERAAIAEHDGRAPREWAEGLARLNGSQPPAGLSMKRWLEVLNDAGRFLDHWARRAAELGWSAADLFGCHPDALDAHVGLQGLVWVLQGRTVVAISADTVVMEGGRGARLTYRRRGLGGAVLWELGDAKPGRHEYPAPQGK